MRIDDIRNQNPEVDNFCFGEFKSKTDIRQFYILFIIWFRSMGVTFIIWLFDLLTWQVVQWIYPIKFQLLRFGFQIILVWYIMKSIIRVKSTMFRMNTVFQSGKKCWFLWCCTSWYPEIKNNHMQFCPTVSRMELFYWCYYLFFCWSHSCFGYFACCFGGTNFQHLTRKIHRMSHNCSQSLTQMRILNCFQCYLSCYLCGFEQS